jgi:hypothetical protein
MKRALLYLLAIATFVACDTTETPDKPQPTPPTPTENEIDIVAEDKLSKRALFAEVKRDSERISLDRLREKAEAFMRSTGKFSGWRVEYKGLSLYDM